MIGDIFIAAVSIAAVYVSYMCGVNDGCKKISCFRNDCKKGK